MSNNLNGHFGKIDVIPTGSADGTKIKGKLSDFKGKYRFMWQDTPLAPAHAKTTPAITLEVTVTSIDGYVTQAEAAEWLHNQHGIPNPYARVQKYIERGSLKKYKRDGKATVLVSMKELKSLNFDDKCALVKRKRVGFNRNPMVAAYKLGVDVKEVLEAIKLGKLKTRQHGEKQVYFYDDIRALFPGAEVVNE